MSEELNRPKIVFVASPEVILNGVFDYTFVFAATPEMWHDRQWGSLVRVDGEGRINPFRGMQVGDWSSPDFCWDLDLFRSSGFVAHASGADSPDSDSLRFVLVQVQQEAILLVSAGDIGRIEDACRVLSISFVTVTTDVPLKTSGNNVGAIMARM